MNILCITTLKLINLQKKVEKIDTFSLNDFFVEIYFNDKNRKLQLVCVTNPGWNETFIFPERAKKIRVKLTENS